MRCAAASTYVMKEYMKPRGLTANNEIHRLRDALNTARRAVLGLMPEQVRKVFETGYDCESSDDMYLWEQNVIAKLLDLARPRPAGEMGKHFSSTERAYCPLCGSSAQSIYEGEGFAFPDGLRRHLEGSCNARQCSVFAVIAGYYQEKMHNEKDWGK